MSDRHLFRMLPGLLACGLYVWAVAMLSHVSPPDRGRIEPVALPLPIQLVVGGGDRFLAANIGLFRTMVELSEVVDFRQDLAYIARFQSDVGWLNPGHEDNYYLAAGLLSGGKTHSVAQSILRNAADARPFDYLPPFFLAFNLMHYQGRHEEAARWMHRAAERDEDEENRAAILRIAIRWAQRGEDPGKVAEMLEAMARDSRSRALQDSTLKRAQQARYLAMLNEAVRRFVQKTGRHPLVLEELVEQGVLDALPVDPVGVGFGLDAGGKPRINRTKNGAKG